MSDSEGDITTTKRDKTETMNEVHVHVDSIRKDSAESRREKVHDLDEHDPETKWKRRRLLLICALGIIVCHFTLGLLQENMYVGSVKCI